MNSDQISSLVRSLMKIIAGILAAHGLQDTATLLNTPDIISAALLIVSLLWSHFNHSAPATGNQGGIGVKLMLALALPALLFTGCAGVNNNTFAGERAAAATADASMRAYAVYWTKAEANPVAYHRTLAGLDSERATLEAASIKVGASIELVENLRAAYATNSAVQPQLNAAVSALASNAGEIVSLVNTFTSVTNTNQ